LNCSADSGATIAGRAGGLLRPGRFLTAAQGPHNRLLVSLCQTMGVDVKTFGDPKYGSGALAGLS
jgi:hypothetical protein